MDWIMDCYKKIFRCFILDKICWYVDNFKWYYGSKILLGVNFDLDELDDFSELFFDWIDLLVVMFYMELVEF